MIIYSFRIIRRFWGFCQVGVFCDRSDYVNGNADDGKDK